MKKKLLIAVSAAIALASCTSDNETNAPVIDSAKTPVAFDSYLVRSRATTLTTLSSIKAEGAGFGVYAYEQGTLPVVDYTNSFVAPNFFANQQVTYNDTATPAAWEYTNIKYWPNNPGAMLSFYAYAPYNASITTDVTSNPRLILNGDYNGPALQYKMPAALNQGVDLCWGQENGKTLAPVNKTKPGVNDKIQFNFKHALSRLGFNIQVFSDQATDGTAHSDAAADAIKDGTTIRVQSLKLIGNFATSGTLSLYDGKWDAPIANTAEYELNGVLNEKISAGLKASDAATELPLFADNDTYVMMIPGGSFKIQITYDVETADPNLPDGKSVVRNVITSDQPFTAQAGVATNYHLNIGMTTVKFAASLVEWNTPNNEEVDLPNNQ